jgi:hypothetical protein
MRKKSLFCQLTLGLLIGGLIIPPQTAQAQFGITHDPISHSTQLEQKIEDALHHVKVMDNAIQQLTTLKGVLGQAEELVTNQFISKQTMSNIGRTVRASFQLKEQVEAIVTTRLTMLKSMDDRLRRGVFDPEADLRDLEDYLRTSIGRSSQDSLANLERLQRMDNTLERMIYELQQAEAALSLTEKKQDDHIKDLAAIYSNPEGKRDPASIDSLFNQIDNCKMLIVQHKDKIEQLRCKIEAHTRKYEVLMDERIKFAERVSATDRAWSDFNGELDGIQRALSKY